MRVAYNITFILDGGHVDSWRKWMSKEFLPRLMSTGCFLNYRFLKLTGLHGEDDPTYSVQLILRDKSLLNRYQKEYESDHNSLLQYQFKDRFVEFRTVMIVVEEG